MGMEGLARPWREDSGYVSLFEAHDDTPQHIDPNRPLVHSPEEITPDARSDGACLLRGDEAESELRTEVSKSELRRPLEESRARQDSAYDSDDESRNTSASTATVSRAAPHPEPLSAAETKEGKEAVTAYGYSEQGHEAVTDAYSEVDAMDCD